MLPWIYKKIFSVIRISVFNNPCLLLTQQMIRLLLCSMEVMEWLVLAGRIRNIGDFEVKVRIFLNYFLQKYFFDNLLKLNSKFVSKVFTFSHETFNSLWRNLSKNCAYFGVMDNLANVVRLLIVWFLVKIKKEKYRGKQRKSSLAVVFYFPFS